MEINPIGRTVFSRRRSHAQEIPNKSKQTRGYQEEDRSGLATYDFERDEVLFIGALADGTWRGGTRGITRVSVRASCMPSKLFG